MAKKWEYSRLFPVCNTHIDKHKKTQNSWEMNTRGNEEKNFLHISVVVTIPSSSSLLLFFDNNPNLMIMIKWLKIVVIFLFCMWKKKTTKQTQKDCVKMFEWIFSFHFLLLSCWTNLWRWSIIYRYREAVRIRMTHTCNNNNFGFFLSRKYFFLSIGQTKTIHFCHILSFHNHIFIEFLLIKLLW